MTHEKEWINLIGEIMIRFAEIESYIAGILISLPIVNQFEKYKDLSFKKRCSAAITATHESLILKKTKQKIIASINDAMKLSEIRNLIAHNPINLNLNSLFEEKIKYEIRSYKNNNKYIELNDLKKKLVIIQSCCKNMNESLTAAEDQIYA